jgi:ectoine hydroxylase-related dioxygenase (phytanoyl-CoA dioxygenase family)
MSFTVNTLIADINAALPSMDATSIDLESFKTTGIAVVRNALSAEQVKKWQTLWDAHRQDSRDTTKTIENENNPVERKQVPDELFELRKESCLLDLLEPVFGKNIGLYQKRFVMKNESISHPVMLHQDSGYHVGTFEKASMFLALKPVNEANGGMFFYPGSHLFGYLGDAGGINPKILPSDWPVVTPELQPGDFVLMKSLTWHGSGPYVSGEERVMTDFIYQNASDPSTREVVRGNSGWEGSFLTEKRSEIFTACRSSKLRQIRSVLDSTT